MHLLYILLQYPTLIASDILRDSVPQEKYGFLYEVLLYFPELYLHFCNPPSKSYEFF